MSDGGFSFLGDFLLDIFFCWDLSVFLVKETWFDIEDNTEDIRKPFRRHSQIYTAQSWA